MSGNEPTVTYVGGPTALVELGGLRLLNDPTFDPAGGEYTTSPVTLRKLAGPALGVDELAEAPPGILSP
jgi:L-ascorbate metabolism protein UlaG (beta-lactamase superfamily)